MKKIVQQMLKSETLVFDREVLEESERAKQEKESILQTLKPKMTEEEYNNLLYDLSEEEKFYGAEAEDRFAEGLRIGILIGLETADIFVQKNSILYKIYQGRALFYETIPLSDAVKNEINSYLAKSQTTSETRRKFYSSILEAEMASIGEYAGQKATLYIRGIRKGIILGREAATVLERYSEGECEEE